MDKKRYEVKKWKNGYISGQEQSQKEEDWEKENDALSFRIDRALERVRNELRKLGQNIKELKETLDEEEDEEG